MTYFTARSNLLIYYSAFLWEKVKTVDFSVTIAASDLKVSRRSHLIDYMKVCEYRRSRSFLDLCQGRVHTEIQTGFSQKLFADLNQFFMKALRYKDIKI